MVDAMVAYSAASVHGTRPLASLAAAPPTLPAAILPASTLPATTASPAAASPAPALAPSTSARMRLVAMRVRTSQSGLVITSVSPPASAAALQWTSDEVAGRPAWPKAVRSATLAQAPELRHSLLLGIRAARVLLSGPEGALGRRVGLWGGARMGGCKPGHFESMPSRPVTSTTFSLAAS